MERNSREEIINHVHEGWEEKLRGERGKQKENCLFSIIADFP